MGYYDELDHEIDKEMGWSDGKRKAKAEGPKDASPRRRPGHWQALLRTARFSSPLFRFFGRIWRGIGKVVFFPVISPLGYSRKFNTDGDMVIVKRNFAWRIADGLLTRLLLTPVILAIFMIGVVYASTHPRAVQAIATPDSMGIYYRRVNLVTVDRQRLTAWYVPPISAQQVAIDPEGMMAQKWPAAVLCHGLGASQDQYLSLAQTLHSIGFAVLMIDMRGQGESDAAAVTYGLRERLDVLAGVKFLRETAYVDEEKVCVVGHDIGATAALQAATLDSSISAVVADGLWQKFEDRARDVFSRPTDAAGWSGGRLPTQWLAPLYTLTFEIAVRDQLNQMDPDAVVRNIHTQPVLFVARRGAEFSPVSDVLTLATEVGGKHEVVVEKSGMVGTIDDQIARFLILSTGWKGPSAHGTEEVQDMLKREVQ